jgi:hypothetical protein
VAVFEPGIEQLRDVPPICEHCYAPVDLVNDPTGYKVCRSWPGTFGLPVFFHTACYKTAAKNIRTK